MNALVLAGGRPDAVAALAPGAPNKAFVPIAGMPMVERVLRALRDVPRIARIVVVAPRAAHADPALALADERRADGARMIDSLASGLAAFAPDELVLVAASDLPALTRASLDDALDRLAERSADVVYGCLARRLHVARYPGIRHTWAPLRDDAYCGAGVSALRPRALPALAGVLDRLGNARKSPLRLASILGWDTLALFALRRLRVEDAERRASAILGVPAVALRCAYPEIAINVDHPADVPVVERLLAER